MARSFTIKVMESPRLLVEKAQKTAQENAALFSGDTQAGNFSGSGVEGHYEVAGDTITVTIDKKPFYAPWSVVETQVKGFFV
jgi:hypothetical protein